MTILDRKLKEIKRAREKCSRHDCSLKKEGSCDAVVIGAVKFCSYEKASIRKGEQEE